MKTVLTLAVAIIMVTSISYAQSQAVKLGVGSLLSNSINLEYEYAVNTNQSAQAEFSVRIPSDIPTFLHNLIEEEGVDRDIKITESNFSNVSIIGEYRFYTGGKVLKGFYVAPYIKYSKSNIDINGTYDNFDPGFNDNDIPSFFTSTFTTFSTGAQLGYQWVIKDNWIIDWSFFGLGVGHNTLDADFTADKTSLFEKWKGNVNEFLDDLPTSVPNSIVVEASNDQGFMRADGSVTLPAIRMSLSVGYTF